MKKLFLILCIGLVFFLNDCSKEDSPMANPLATPLANPATEITETSFKAKWNFVSSAQIYLLDVSLSPDFTDFVELQNFFNHVQLLRDAFYFSGDKAYAHKALQLINTWFLDEKTKMNPNLNYGQGIPGLNDGREFGIIEFAKLVEVIKCVELFDKHKLLDKQTEAGMRNWLTEYAYWLQNSTIAKDARSRHNNHGTYYDGQLLSVLVYLGRIDEVKNHLSNITINRIK